MSIYIISCMKWYERGLQWKCRSLHIYLYNLFLFVWTLVLYSTRKHENLLKQPSCFLSVCFFFFCLLLTQLSSCKCFLKLKLAYTHTHLQHIFLCWICPAPVHQQCLNCSGWSKAVVATLNCGANSSPYGQTGRVNIDERGFFFFVSSQIISQVFRDLRVGPDFWRLWRKKNVGL